MSKKNKRGLSEVISTLLIIILTIVALAGIWIFVQNFVVDTLGTAKKCSGITEKIAFGEGTCYFYQENPEKKELHIQLNRKDLKMDGVLIAVTSLSGESKSFKIMEDQSTKYTYVKELTGSYNIPLELVKEDEGKTYVFNLKDGSFGEPKTIELVPIIEKEYCSSVDLWNNIPKCPASS